MQPQPVTEVQPTDLESSLSIEGRPGRWRIRRAAKREERSVWPDRRQELLLKAALFRGDVAISAWRDWEAQIGTDTPDPSSRQIFPLVYCNLRDQAVRGAHPASLRANYLFTWGRNQKIFRILRATLGRLHAAQIETLVFKGAALIPLYYRDPGARGMGDVDVLVKVDQFHRGIELLRSAGWVAQYWSPEHFDTRFEHAIGLVDRQGDSIDLHCHALMACCDPGADEQFWEASLPAKIEGIETRTLCPTDAVLHACVHGMNWVKHPPLRWVADAITVMRAVPDPIDWDRLILVSRARGVTSAVAESLEYLRKAFDAPIPTDVTDRLCASPTARADRRRYLVWSTGHRGHPIRRLQHHWFMYSRGVGQVGPFKRMTTIPQYLRFWAHTDRLWKIPPRLARKAFRAVGNRFGLYQYWDS